MSDSPQELIQRYLLGAATADEVRDLEARLLADPRLQDEYLFQAALDSHLRQFAQADGHIDPIPVASSTQDPASRWKWISGVSTAAAAALIGLLVLHMSAERAALAHPSLGHLTVTLPSADSNIWRAAAEGNLDAIREWLGTPGAVDSKAPCGLTPLHAATLADRSEIVACLLRHSADVSSTDREGNTPLHMASFLGRTDIVRLLVAAGADPTLRNHLGFSSMDNVAITWSEGLESYYHHIERSLDTSLDLGRIRGERPVILKLMASGRPATALTPSVSIWRAAMTGNTAALEQHLTAGTDLDGKDDLTGSTPLIVATTFGQHEAARLLISAGANLDLQNDCGSTALHVGCFFSRPAIVDLLLTAGADPHRLDNWNLTPLGVASSPFTADLEGVYRHAYESLNLPFEGETVRRARDQLVRLLEKIPDGE